MNEVKYMNVGMKQQYLVMNVDMVGVGKTQKQSVINEIKKNMATINYGKHNHIVTCINNYFIECYNGIEAFTKGQWYLADKVTFGNTYQFKIYRGTSFKTFNKEEFEEYFAQ